PGGDRVVVPIAALVVEKRLALERVLGVTKGDRVAVRGLARDLERGQRRAGVAAGARGEELDRLVLDGRRVRQPALVGEGAPQQREHVRVLELAELVDRAARQ